jgi:hypothetical protein
MRKEVSAIQLFVRYLQTIIRKIQIRNLCRELDIRMITVKEITAPDSNSRYPSRIVAYTLNWLFSTSIKPSENENIVCLIDSDMFFTSPLSIEEILDNQALAIIPQYRAETIQYLWTGFAIFDFAKLENPQDLDFSLGIIDGHRCDVGGMTHHYLQKYTPQCVELEFINLVFDWKDGDYIYAETHISGNVALNLKYDKELTLLEIEVKNSHSQVDSVLGSNKNQIIQNYEKSVAAAINYCKNLSLDPKNVDLILPKHSYAGNFLVLHYKNGSNPRDFEDKRYSNVKLDWCKLAVMGQEKQSI